MDRIIDKILREILLNKPLLFSLKARLIVWLKAEAAKSETPIDDQMVLAFDKIADYLIEYLVGLGRK